MDNTDMNRMQKRVFVGGLACVAGLVGFSPAWADAHLHCQVSYAGSTQTVLATPTDDPYRVAAVDIAGRFRFKPVLVRQAEQLGQVRYVNIYVYLQTERQPVLLQQAKYLPPYPPPGPDGRIALTGEQRLYAGPMERELIYQCELMAVAP